jgi:transaldolase
LLWASTSTKNPSYSDTKYVEPLIGADTINTMPVETVDAYRDHGHPRLGVDEDVSKAYHVLGDLSSLGIDLDAATEQLEQQGVQNFISASERLMARLQEKRAAVHPVTLGTPDV